MKYSRLFGKTIKKVADNIKVPSHKLLVQSGYIRESTSGRYYFLPLGIKVRNQIINIIREEMDKSGAQETLAPVLHPIEFWRETNRTESVGFELTKIKDRKGAEFVLGGTAEEMFVALVKQFNLSYRDLPFNIYQFSSKFRDEVRARGGLLRTREFTMKDAYSFDQDENSFQKTYEKMKKTYKQIFERLGFEVMVVEADNGYIGGDYCHEFVVESEFGESRFLVTENMSYAAHEDVAKFVIDKKNTKEKILEYQEVEAIRGNTVKDGAALHHLPLWQQLKNVLMITDRGELILAVIRGDLDVNETKLKKILGINGLRIASREEILSIGSEPGFISPVNIKNKSKQKIKIVGDFSLRTIRNAYSGANQKNRDALNINIDRDYRLDIEADIAMAKAGFLSEKGEPLIEKKGIEVGNIFQLGYHYSKLMDAKFMDENGAEKFFYMGCYGIGIGRTMAAIVEKYHDEKGIVWPSNISPFEIHLLGLNMDDIQVRNKAEELYQSLLKKGFTVLFDDREIISAGEKFADADLIGVPYRLLISKKNVAQGKIELKNRISTETKMISYSEIFNYLKEIFAK